MSSSSYRAAVERLSAQLDILHSRFTTSATLPVHPSRSPSHSPTPRFPASHTLHSSQPNPAFFLASMGFQSEAADVEALDKYLEAITDRRFAPSGVLPTTESALLHQHQSPPQRHPSPSLHSPSPSSAAPSATHTRTPKRPRTTPLSVSRSSRVEDSTPGSASFASVKKAHDKRTRKYKSRSSASTAVELRLRVRAPDEPELPHDRQPSQSSHRSKQRKRDTHRSSPQLHDEHDDVQADVSDGPKPLRKRRETSKRKRRPRPSRDEVHDEDDHIMPPQSISTPKSSHESRPQRSIAKRKSKFEKEKQRKRHHPPSASDDSIAQSGNESEQSDHSDQSIRKPASRKRRKVAAAIESETEEPISQEAHVPSQSPVADASPDIKDRLIEEDDENLSAAPNSQHIETSEVTHSPDPLTSLLTFARKSGSLSTVDGMTKVDVIKHRQSLATIPGCGQFKEFSLFRYCKALCHHHKQKLESMKIGYDGHILKGKQFDALAYDVDDGKWRDWLAEDGDESEIHPPGLSKMFDTIQFLRRLLEVISVSDDDIAAPFMERFYGEGLTVDVASLTLGVLQFWYHAKRDKVESEENYSELVDWAIRLAISIVIYELSPLSFISRVENLRAQSFFISGLHTFKPDEQSVSFEKLLSFSMEFLQGCPTTLAKECRNSVSELMQVFLLRRSIPWDSESPQRELWERIGEESVLLPQALCQQEFFWLNSFSKALQQVRREPLSGDSFFDVGFLVSIASSPLFMRELLQNQSKCLALLCDVMTKSLDVISREPLMAFRTILSESKNFPSVPTVLDLIQTLLSSAVMQRELLATDVMIKDLFLDSVHMLLIRTARMGSTMHFQNKLETLAENSFLRNTEMDFIVDEPLTSSGISDEKVMTRQRILAFDAVLLASMGKSLEDGSRDMSQMNALKAFLKSKAGSTRNRRRTWEVVLRIQGGLEDHYIDHGVKKSVLSPEDRNHFTMAVEVIRKHFQRCPTDSSKTSCSTDEKSSSSLEEFLPRKRSLVASFPPVTSNSLLCRTASQGRGHFDLDFDPNVLQLVQSEAQQTLARYDPETEFAWKWVRLQRKNAYIDRARDLLEKNDRTLGQKCSCLPGNAKEKRDGSKNRVACSNELCENRHLRIECVPGECGAGSYCQNQRLQRLEYAKFKMVSFPNKGVGLVADEDIRTGDLIGEYQGEVISMETFRERMREYQGERHFYFMTLTNKLIIDASRKSQATRFLNHSCDPNAETQKWNAGGEPRVGIYAVRDIAKGEEITFDYGARSIEKGSAPCVCQSSKCRGTLTSKQEELNFEPASKNSKPNDGIKEKRLELEGRSVAGTEQGGRDVEKIVQAKIGRAKKDLQRASELLAECKREDWTALDLTQMSPSSRERLRSWKERIAKYSQSKPSISRMDVDSAFRIPRRSMASNMSDGERVSTARDNLKRRQGSYSESGREIEAKSIAAASSTLSIPRVPRRSAVIADLRPRVPLSKVPGNTGTVQKLSQVSLEKKIDSERPLSRVALIGREQGFQPSSTRHKRKPLKPKVKERMKTRKAGSDNDSMGEYSTASEAEPIMDEKPLSPSQLPDGQGARSDDEFVADSPLEPLHVHREERKVEDQYQIEYRKQDDSIQQRREKRESGAHQKPAPTENPNSSHVHNLERTSHPPHFPSQDFERSQYAGGKAEHIRHSQGSNGIRHSGYTGMESREPYADRDWMASSEAHESRPRSLGKDVRDSHMSQRPWPKDRLPRETDYHDRNPQLPHESFRRHSPRLSRERETLRDYSRNRLERPRFSDGGRAEPFRRHEQYVARDRGYNQNYSERQHRVRERRRWAEAIREEPVRPRDVGNVPHDFVPLRPLSGAPFHNRDHPPREHPPRDHPPRNPPPRDHPPRNPPPRNPPPRNPPPRNPLPRDHPPRDHPPRDHPPRDHPPRDHPPRDHPPRDYPPRDHPPRDHPPRNQPPRDQPPRDRPHRDHPPRAQQRETGPKVVAIQTDSDGRQQEQNSSKTAENVNPRRNSDKASDKAPSTAQKSSARTSVAKIHQPSEFVDEGRKERFGSRFSQPSGKDETPSNAKVDIAENGNVVDTSKAKASTQKETRLDSKLESKSGPEPETVRQDDPASARKGTEGPQRAHQISASRMSLGAPSTVKSQTALEPSKSSRSQRSLEATDAATKPKQAAQEGAKSTGIEAARNSRSQSAPKGLGVKQVETKASNSASASFEPNAAQGIPKRSSEREEMRRSRFQADELRSGSNKRVLRDGDSNEKLGPNQVKRRRREGDFRTSSGLMGKAGEPSMGRGSLRVREGVGKQISRYGESRIVNEHDRRDKWKSFDAHDGYDEGGFRRRSSEGHRDDRKRFRHRSPTRGGKKKKKLGRDGPRASGVIDKGREEGRRSQGSAPVVRGSTQQDLRSLLRKGRATE